MESRHEEVAVRQQVRSHSGRFLGISGEGREEEEKGAECEVESGAKCIMIQPILNHN